MALRRNEFMQYSPEATWDPLATLDILNYDHGGRFTCVGYAPSQHRRCRNPINQQNRNLARETLEEIAEVNPDYSLLSEDLRELAETCLCVRYHKTEENINAVLSNWKMVLEKLKRKHNVKARKLQHTSTFESPASRSIDFKRSPVNEDRLYTLKLPPPSNAIKTFGVSDRRNDTKLDICPSINKRRTSTVNQEINSGFGIKGLSAHVVVGERQSSTKTSGIPNNNKNADETWLTESEPSTPKTEDFKEPDQSAESEDSATSADEDEQLDVADISVSPPDSVQRRNNVEVDHEEEPQIGVCSSDHVPRRPLNENCLICKEICQDLPLNELTWCKSTCGHNMHKICFEEWRPWAEKSRGGLRCALWLVTVTLSGRCSMNYRLICCYSHGEWSQPCEHDEEVPKSIELERPDIWAEQDEWLLLIALVCFLIAKDMLGWTGRAILSIPARKWSNYLPLSTTISSKRN
jgi:hypothetical protein